MKLLYLGYYCPWERYEAIVSSGVIMSAARQRWEHGMLRSFLGEGMIHQRDLTIVSYLPRPAGKAPLPEEESEFGVTIRYAWARRERVSTYFGAMRRIRQLVGQWIKDTQGCQRVILTYATNPLLLMPIKRLLAEAAVKIATICSEVPMYRNMTVGSRAAIYWKKKIFTYLNESMMDGYVFLTEAMNDLCNTGHKPWVLVEGMADVVFKEPVDAAQGEVLLYAGGLHKENGICKLVEAFDRLNRNDAKLVLYGDGNALSYVREMEACNPCIVYGGTMPNSEVRKAERQATLLVNPRCSDMELSKYSFPSKVLEYMSTGVPALITRLPGIPQIYFDYCYSFEDESVEGMTRTLQEILNIPRETRRLQGRRARDFVTVHKTPQVQSGIIFGLLKRLSDNEALSCAPAGNANEEGGRINL